MINATHLKGIFTALPTPVLADGTIDLVATRGMISYQVRNEVQGLVPVGGTGEYGALARRERIRMVETTAELAEGLPVVAGVLDPGYYDALAAGKDLAEAGADALLVVTPYYTNPTQNGLREYFLRYADASPVPVLIYEIPYRTRIAIEPTLLHELSRHENIIGMKACNTDMYHFLQVVAGVDASFSVLSGEDTLFPLHIMGGAAGGIVVTATLLPQLWSRLYSALNSGNAQEALALHGQLIPMMHLAFCETNPGPMKSVLDMITTPAPHLLTPLVAAAPAVQEALRAELLRLFTKFDICVQG